MFGWLITLGVPARFAKPVGYLLAALALFLLVASLWRCSVDDAVGRRESDQRASNVEQARAADNAAAATARADEARTRDEADEIKGILENEPDAPLTDSERALLTCVRLQQSARANGKPAPAC